MSIQKYVCPECKELDDFMGTNVKHRMITWLNDFFDNDNTDIKKYCMLYGLSGNGKTTLCELLAKEFEAELLTIGCDDINSGKDVYNFIKSLNLRPSKHKRKIIMFEGFDEFHCTYREKLIDVRSKYPIIYTCKYIKNTCKGIKKNPESLMRKSLVVEVKKPLSNELFKYLKTMSDLPDDTLKRIAKESRSVRSAVNSLINSSVNELIDDIETDYTLLRDFRDRELKHKLTRRDIKVLFDSIRGYDLNAVKLRARLADLDWRMSRYWREIGFREVDPFLLNNMIEDIEEVELELPKKGNKKMKREDAK